jgi:two-component system sensor histidine kinase CiaH
MKDKFQSARLRLTAWYLLIIMVISIFYSVAFYNSATNEIERVINRIEFRQQHPHEKISDRTPPHDAPNPPTLEELQETKNRLLFILVFINGSILIAAGGAGYFLAGRTLRPIKLMIDEQNQFITSSSHELRTPIATMRSEMEASLMEKHISDDFARELITSNLEELGTIQLMTNDLLKLALIHNPNNTSSLEELSIKELLHTAKKRVLPLAKKKEITLTTTLQEAIVYGQKGRLVELFVILLDNAIKYSSEKTAIVIQSETVRGKTKINIADNGIGISEKDLPHIFDRFYRADTSRSQTEGFGLGLSIAKRIAEAHNGAIHVTSELGKGTSFIITLPAKSA